MSASRSLSALLFVGWLILNQGKMTKLPILGDGLGYMFTDLSLPSVVGGVAIHLLAFFVCICLGHVMGLLVPRRWGGGPHQRRS